MKNNKLIWNVWISDANTREIITYNIFDHYNFFEDCKKNYIKNKNDKEKFIEILKKDLLYFYWSKCEWEILVHHWPPHKNDKERKIDVYQQVMINWDNFVEYIWNNKEKFK